MAGYDTISFLSDYGTGDEFVGVVKSVIRTMAPDVVVIDITHDITPFDVRAGGLALARSAQYLAPGVVIAVVDPGVGTERRPIAVEVGDGASILVGPDNGVLAPAVALCGGATRAVALDRAEHHLPAPGATFAGRDVFAPVAARLCEGLSLEEVGTIIEPATLLPGTLPVAREETDGTLVAEVLWVDRFGNCQLNVEPDMLDPWGDRLRLSIRGSDRSVIRTTTFADLRPGAPGLVLDSYGMLAIAVERGSAAAELGIDEGDEVVLGPAPDEPETGSTTRVTIRDA